jgi:putative ATP-binding cassette transporter
MMGFLLGRSRWVLSLAVLTGLLAGLGGTGLLAVINHALETGGAAMAWLGWSLRLEWLFLGLCVVMILTRVVSSFLLLRLTQNAVFDLRLTLSRQILLAPLPRLQELGSARVLACLTQDVNSLAEALRWLPAILINLAVVAGCFAYLAWLSPLLVGLVAATVLIGILSFRWVEGRALRGLQAARDHDDALYGHFRSLTHGVKELKLHHQRRAAFLSECLETTAAHCRGHYLAGMRMYLLALNWGFGLFYVLIGGLLFVLPHWQELPSETLRGACLTILYLISPLEALMEGLPALGQGAVALRKIRALSQEQTESGIGTGPSTPVRPAELELVGVTHRYRTDRDDHGFTLGPINLYLRPGELVFLIGGNGSGKTTLSMLLLGLYTPEQGEIRLGGRRIADHNREGYRQLFSAVFADFYLFDSLLGLHDRELDAEARAYLAQLQLDHKVSIDNGAFSTLELSQGQRKRLALLVAYLEDRPFYLFDEWAADQDPLFKKIFYTEILPALKARGKTVIVITHDDGYFHIADRCLKLNEGRLTELPAAEGRTFTRPVATTGHDLDTNQAEVLL